MEARNHPLRELEIPFSFQKRAHSSSIEPAIALRSRRPDGGALGTVQHAELDPRQVGGSAHDATQGIDFANDRALGDPADRGIARHLPDGFEVLGEEQRPRAAPRRQRGRLGAGVATPDDDHIVLDHNGTPEYHSAMTYQIKIDRRLCSGYGECVGLAPEVFHLGDDNVSVVVDPEGSDDETILDAARACPVDAITLLDEFDEQVWPA